MVSHRYPRTITARGLVAALAVSQDRARFVTQ